MGQVKLYVLAALILGGVVSLGVGARQVYKMGYNAATLDHDKLIAAQRAIAEEFDLKVAKHIGTIQVRHVTIRQNLEKELTRDVVYRECNASDRVFQLSNEALTDGANASSGSILPSPEPSDR